MAKKKIEKGVVRYTDGTGSAGNVNSTVGKGLEALFNHFFTLR